MKSENGAILVAQGQRVDQNIIEKAKQAGKEAELLAAVNMTTGSAMTSSAMGAGHSLQDSASAGAETVKDKAVGAWETIKDKATSMKDKAADEWEDSQIKAALGRRVNHLILDTDDTTILEEGDIITHEAIEKAKKAGMLKVLLDSVKRDDSDII